MITRITIGSLAVAFIIALVAGDALIARYAPLSNQVIIRGSLIPLAIAILSVLGSFEIATLLRRTGHAPYLRFSILCAVALVLAPWIAPTGMLGQRLLVPGQAHLVIFSIAMLGIALIGVARRDVHDGLHNLAASGLIVAYLGWLPSFLTQLRCDLPGEQGAWIVLLIVLICKVGDIGAYFTGSAIGRTKLIPAVSPKKTVEGLIGGIAASCAVSLLFWYCQRKLGEVVTESATITLGNYIRSAVVTATALFSRLTMLQSLVLGAVIAVAGQLGDLVESVIKRSAGAKDSASLVPGFGGILDMIDSPVAAAPVAWILLTAIWGVL